MLNKLKLRGIFPSWWKTNSLYYRSSECPKLNKTQTSEGSKK